jgi:hypothetical protein
MNAVLDMKNEVTKAAKTVAFQWPGIVEADDLEQDITLHLLDRPGSVEKLLRDFDDRQRLNAIIKIGHQIAAQERTDYDLFSGNFRYSVNEVKQILEDRVLHNESPELGSNWSVTNYTSSGGEFADTVNTKLATETDLRRGMAHLRKVNSKYAEAIDSRYLRDEVIPRDDRAQKTLLGRALTALTTQMNRSYKRQFVERPDGPGTRKTVGRRAAGVKSSQQYDGSHEGWMSDWTGGRTS